MNYYKEGELKKVLIHELGHFVAHKFYLKILNIQSLLILEFVMKAKNI